ncbi:Mrp family chromosome partitioning ATPase [Hamadaea flava]|uniref:Uncharacterized protein n=1 Tax=Hamadaea flava TaxID=1742688 RepID=A0ABV8LL38_9ACTN|nr:hypothetical protein [Hamadaea flava]MCP2323909.1 Mrp family chromosome partitioning ATPase [Hamadaea flava]
MKWFTDPDEVAEERAAAAALRRLPVGGRVVAVCSGAGGVGATSIAAGIGATLAALWPGRIAYAGLLSAPPIAGVHVAADTMWTDQVTLDAVVELRDRHSVLLLDLGVHASRTTRILLSTADRIIVVTDEDGLGEERALARVNTAAPATKRTVAGRPGQSTHDRFVIPPDKAFAQLDAELLERAKPATCRALLRLAAWCV